MIMLENVHRERINNGTVKGFDPQSFTEGKTMYVQSLQSRKTIEICRSVYSKEELQEIESYAERGGARIVKMSASGQGGRMSVWMELDLGKRQF